MLSLTFSVRHCLVALLVYAVSFASAEDTANRRQVEVTSPTPLLNPDGSLAAWGWGRRALMTYNRDAIDPKLHGRIKEWEHYTVMSPDFTVGVTIAQLGSMAFGSVEVIDYKAKTNRSGMFLDVRKKEVSTFPSNPYGTTDFRRNNNFISFAFDADRRHIALSLDKSATAPAIKGNLELIDKQTEESIAITRPFSPSGHFFYENKICGMPARGTVEIGAERYELPEGKSFAIFDWGRGIWPRESAWFWGQGAGEIAGRRVAINLGHGYGDDARGTANAVIIDGHLEKLGVVECDFDPKDRMQPWSFRSDDGRLQLEFEPFYHQESKQNIGVAAAELHKIHGVYSGSFQRENGQRLQIHKLLGFAEHMNQRW